MRFQQFLRKNSREKTQCVVLVYSVYSVRRATFSTSAVALVSFYCFLNIIPTAIAYCSDLHYLNYCHRLLLKHSRRRHCCSGRTCSHCLSDKKQMVLLVLMNFIIAFFDMLKFTTLTPLLDSCKLSYLNVCLKIYSLPTFAMKLTNNFSRGSWEIKQIQALVPHKSCLLYDHIYPNFLHPHS